MWGKQETHQSVLPATKALAIMNARPGALMVNPVGIIDVFSLYIHSTSRRAKILNNFLYNNKSCTPVAVGYRPVARTHCPYISVLTFTFTNFL